MTYPEWLNGWPRMGSGTVLMGTGVHCAGCGRGFGITTVSFDKDWIQPEKEPDWPFLADDCPVCIPRRLGPHEATPEELAKRFSLTFLRQALAIKKKE